MDKKQTVSFLDKMPENLRKKYEDRAEKRQNTTQTQGLSVPPEFYDASLLGYYYGWEAIMAFRRGYTIVPKTDEDLAEDKKAGRKPEWTSKYKREMLTYAEAQVLIEGANKVWYKKLTEQAHAGVISNSYTMKGTYDQSIKPLEEQAKI